MTSSQRRGLSRIELLFGLAIAPLALSIVVPIVSHARGLSLGTTSHDNLRILGAAHLVYAADWNGRQLTFVDDLISTYGAGTEDAFTNYWEERGGNGESTQHPPVALGWARSPFDNYFWAAYRTGGNSANASLTLPIVFFGPSSTRYFGAFRMPNAVQFHRYLNGRFYDRLFYPPTDAVVVDAVGEGFDDPDEYWNFADVCPAVGSIPAWSSYCLSPAAMFNPAVMAHDDPDDDDFNGWRDPWELIDGFQSPSLFHAEYPSLKTHMLEHHWLQDAPEECNPAFDPGTYGEDCCEPYYFNHGLDSRPVTLFYDGHVAELPVADAVAADELVRQQQNPNWGLWSKDTVFGEDGYLSQYGFDDTQTSFHVLTTDGILGRDITAVGLEGDSDRTASRRREVRSRPRYPLPTGAGDDLLSYEE